MPAGQNYENCTEQPQKMPAQCPISTSDTINEVNVWLLYSWLASITSSDDSVFRNDRQVLSIKSLTNSDYRPIKNSMKKIENYQIFSIETFKFILRH